MNDKLKEIRDSGACSNNETHNMFYKKGFDAAIAALEGMEKVVEIPEVIVCNGCKFYYDFYDTCTIYDKKIHYNDQRPSFCKAKTVSIRINE
jgi:hypothetical protein